MKIIALFVAMLLALAPLPSVAQDSEFSREQRLIIGALANVSGDYATALQEFASLAEQGDAEAQVLVGKLYRSGDGVLQDYITAHMWFNIAAANGDDLGAKERKSVARLMSQTDISEAQRRARVCMGSGYQDCDAKPRRSWWPW
jgi:TPR repeat protein